MGMNVSIEGSNPSFSVEAKPPAVRLSARGGVAERSNAAVSKTVSGFWVRRGFKSLPLRLQPRAVAAPGWAERPIDAFVTTWESPSPTGDEGDFQMRRISVGLVAAAFVIAGL